MNTYLIALDLDGTILYDFDSLSEELCLFMRKVQQHGHKIVIATGRPYRSSKFVYERFGLQTPIINYNGGLVTHPQDALFPHLNYTIRKEAIIDIFDQNIHHIRNAFSEVKDSIYLYREEKSIEPLLHVDGASLIKVGHLKDTLETDPNGFIIIGKQGQGHYIADYINHRYQGEVLARIWDLSGEYDSIVEVYTPETNKGKALEYVAHFLGFSRSGVIAIGDGHNDIELLEYAHIGVAVKNAHPDLLKVADIILEHTAKEGAVDTFLRGFLRIQ
jgi:Cof subfamily protein (haloacid dehalogenase superfamily)